MTYVIRMNDISEMASGGGSDLLRVHSGGVISYGLIFCCEYVL